VSDPDGGLSDGDRQAKLARLRGLILQPQAPLLTLQQIRFLPWVLP
jgi:hypothetical protein